LVVDEKRKERELDEAVQDELDAEESKTLL
jgi:hypothetical protein